MSQERTERAGTPPHSPAGSGVTKPAPSPQTSPGARQLEPVPHPRPFRTHFPSPAASPPAHWPSRVERGRAPAAGIARAGAVRSWRGSPWWGRPAPCAGGCEEHVNWRRGSGSGCYYRRASERAQGAAAAGGGKGQRGPRPSRPPSSARARPQCALTSRVREAGRGACEGSRWSWAKPCAATPRAWGAGGRTQGLQTGTLGLSGLGAHSGIN